MRLKSIVYSLLCVGVGLVSPFILSTKLYASAGDCFVCHNNKEFEMTLDDGSVVSLYISPERYRHSIHGKFDCIRCHTDYTDNPHEQRMVKVKTDEKEIEMIAKVRSREKFALLACINCHLKQFDEYRQSIHGTVVLKGNPDAPECVDCHGNHYIKPSDDLESTVNPVEVPATCAKCHNKSLLMAKYDINTHTYMTYEESFHGKKLKLGSGRVAACTSCHGVHNIKEPEDPASTVYPANRAKTCGKCHKGANEEFARGFSHIMPSPKIEPLVFYVGLGYKWIIFIMISGMIVYIMLDLFRRIFSRRT